MYFITFFPHPTTEPGVGAGAWTQACLPCACVLRGLGKLLRRCLESGYDMVKNPAAGVLVALDRFDALSHLTPIKVG